MAYHTCRILQCLLAVEYEFIKKFLRKIHRFVSHCITNNSSLLRNVSR